MTTPTVVKRNLTFDFSRSIEYAGQAPSTMEVAIVALFDASSPVVDQSFVSPEPVVQTVLLANEHNVLTFSLVPSNAAYLTAPINYRVMWRQGQSGRTYDQVISMPDQDVTYDQLSSLGAILGGSSFLQVTDLGKPGRVAQLNTAGQVVDAFGVPVADSGDISIVNGLINAEINARQIAINNLSAAVNNTLTQQIEATLSTAQAQLDTQVVGLNNAIEQAEAQASNQVAAESARAQEAELGIWDNANSIAEIHTDLTKKADLDDHGYVPMSQMNPAATSSAVEVANQAAMLALTPNQVQPGDLAIRPNGIYLLIATDPSVLSNWLDLSKVTSVNGKQGDVVLTAADIGALATNGNITQGQVLGLTALLSTLTPWTTTTQIQSAVQAILGDTTYAHTSGGLLGKALMPVDSVYIDSSSSLRKKDGTLITGVGGSSGGGTGTGNIISVNGKAGVVVLSAGDVGAIPVGGHINENQVDGLAADMATKVGTTDPRLADARTPLAHAASHASTGTDPVHLTTDQIVNLTTSLTTINNSLSSLQTAVTTLETGGGGDVSSVLDGGTPDDPGAGSLPQAGVMVFWEAPALESGPTPASLAAQVSLHSPFGFDTTGSVTGTAGNYYANPAGAASTDVLIPSLTPNGHLVLTKWDETAPADIPPASSSDLASLAAVVATKANESELVGGLASKAALSDLAATNGNVSALQTQVTSLATGVVLVSNLPDIPEFKIVNLVSDLAAKASVTGLATAVASITAVQNALPNKADLGPGGTVPLNQMSQVIPQTYVQSLTTDLANRATAGQLGTTNAAVAALQAALPNKADLDPNTHQLLSSQIPGIALDTINVVANRAAMLALSPATVHRGSVCVISATADLGTYILNSTDPSQFVNWVELPTTTGNVSSVNGYTGTVVLSAADVGAVSSGATIPQSQVTNLPATIASLATNTALASAVSGLVSASQVNSSLQTSVSVKQAVAYVSTTPIASLSGQQAVDGVVAGIGATVLLTAQASSVNNGLWVVSSGSWSRAVDFPSGSYFLRDTIVLVQSGATKANTIWQQTNVAGTVDTNANNWSLAMQAGPPLQYVAGNGLGLSGLNFTVTPGTGISVGTGGVSIDTAIVPRKYSVTLNGGSTVQVINHGLNTTDIAAVYVKDTASGTMVLAGAPVIINANSLSIEFKTAPAAGAYRVTILG